VQELIRAAYNSIDAAVLRLLFWFGLIFLAVISAGVLLRMKLDLPSLLAPLTID
jgi:hypothetical protein